MPKKSDAGDSFSFAELALAGAMTKRAFQHVADAERPSLLPPGNGIKVLKRIAVIGAIMNSGVPLFLAARISRTILNEFNQPDGEAPSGLSGFVRAVVAAKDRDIRPLTEAPSDGNDYWYHLTLYRNPAIYGAIRGMRQSSDFLLHISDRRTITYSTPNFSKPSLVGWVEEWERGTSASVKYATEVLGSPDPEKPEEWQEKVSRLNREALAAQVNAVGRLTVNVSLAIRSALDRVQDHRHGVAPLGRSAS